MKQLVEKYAIFTIGLYLLAAGIVLILRSTLGTTPISSVNYVLSLNTPMSFGTATVAFNLCLIVGQFLLIRSDMTRTDMINILLQIPFSFLFGVFIDLNMALTRLIQPHNYVMALVCLALGCIVQAAGVTLEVKPRVTMMSAEGFVYYAARRYRMEFGKCKVIFDISLVTLAGLLSLLLAHRIEGIREGTVIAACITGHIVTFMSRRIFTQTTLHRLLPGKRQQA